MIRTVILAALALVCAASNAEARQRHRTYLARPDCNVTMPCEGVAPSPRGEKIEGCRVRCRSEGLHAARSGPRARRPRFGCHPAGCPSRAFCGCGAAVRSPIRSLWLAANWFKFPRAAPSAGMVAVRRHHVFVLEAYLGGDTWQVYDANSGIRPASMPGRSRAM